MNDSQSVIKFNDYAIVFWKDVANRETPYRDTLLVRVKPRNSTNKHSEVVEKDLPILYGTVSEREQLPQFEVEADTVEFEVGQRGATVLFTEQAYLTGQIKILDYTRTRLVKQCADTHEFAAFQLVFQSTQNTITIPATGDLVFDDQGATTPSTGVLTMKHVFEMQAHLAGLMVPGYRKLHLYTNYIQGSDLVYEIFDKGWYTETGSKENRNSDFRTYNVFGVEVKIIPFPYIDENGDPDNNSYLFTEDPGLELVVLKETLVEVVLETDAKRFQQVSWKSIIGFCPLPGQRVWKINAKA